MEFFGSLANFLKTSLILAYIIVFLSIPTIIKRIRFGSKKRDFRCLMCGNCCRFNVIALTEKDVKRIRDAGYKDFVEKTSSGEKKLMMVHGRCLFNKNDKCSIYDYRPRVCREFPFQKFFGVPYLRDWSCCPGIKEFKKRGERVGWTSSKNM